MSPRPPKTFQADADRDIAVAAAVAQWVEQRDTPAALAPPIVRANGRPRIATLDRQWPLPRTELVR